MSEFELTVSVSGDTRLAETVREVVVCAAQCAGCAEAAATAFGRHVEDAVRSSQLAVPGGAMLPVTVRRGRRHLEVVVNGHTLTLDA